MAVSHMCGTGKDRKIVAGRVDDCPNHGRKLPTKQAKIKGLE